MRAVRMACLLAAASLLPAQQQAPPPLPASSYPGLIVSLRTASGATVFPLGARIQIEIVYQSSLPGKYIGDPNRIVRGCGQMPPQLAPGKGWHDPRASLDRLYVNTIRVCAWSARAATVPLTMKPVTAPMELNEWVRFDRPGIYEVMIPTAVLTAPAYGSPSHFLPVLSAPLRLTLVPPPSGWHQAQIQRAQLEMAKPTESNHYGADALPELASLGGADATAVLAAHYRGGQAIENIAETEAPSGAIPVFEHMLVDPGAPVDRTLLDALVTCRLLANHGTSNDWSTERAAALAELSQALPRKQQSALEGSLASAVSYSPEDLPASVRPWLTQTLDDDFGSLDQNGRQLLLTALQGAFDPLAGPAELDLVRRAATEPLETPFPGIEGSERAAALRRWYALAPAEARPAVVSAIASAFAGGRELGFLADKTVSEADQPLLNQLGKPSQNAAELIARYGSPTIASAVVSFLDTHSTSRDCGMRAPLLAYLLRVRPDLAAPRLAAAFQPYPGGCGSEALERIAVWHNAPVLMRFAMQQLGNPDAAVGACPYLADHSSPAVLPRLWQVWNNPSLQSNFQDSFRSCLLHAQAWLIGPAEIRRLERGASPKALEGLEAWLAAWQSPPWPIRRAFNGYSILQYSGSESAIRAKLAQFPAGSHFQCQDFTGAGLPFSQCYDHP